MASKSPSKLGMLWKRITDIFWTIVSSIEGTIGTSFIGFLRAVIPPPLQFLIPFIRDDLGIRPPSLRRLVGVGVPEQAETREIIDQVVLPPKTAQLWQVKPQFTRYRCVVNNPFRCEFPKTTIEESENNRYCLKCQFPALLPPEVKIRGKGGIYQVEKFIGYRGLGRLYEVVNTTDGQTAILKEYVIPSRDFNREETQITKDSFLRLAGITLADGRCQNFRLILPIDAIVDPQEERCYLLYAGKISSAPTLAEYLALHGAMDSWQVHSFLFQILQILESLHSQKYRLPSGSLQSQLPHGNLSLYSLLVTENLEGFHVYLSDLGLWEHRFYSPLMPPTECSVQSDLQDVGYIAFYLLTGGIVDLEQGFAYDPNQADHWQKGVHPLLKSFLYNLIGIGSSSYDSAETARRALTRLLMERPIDQVTFIEPVVLPKTRSRQWWRKGISALAIILPILVALWLFLPQLFAPRPTREVLPCCMEQVAGIPTGRFNYAADREGTWSYVLLQDNLIAKGTNLEAELRKRQPKLQLNFQPVANFSQALGLTQAGQTNFAISSQISNLGADLTFRTIAYDGLTVFVAFSYAKRDNSLPNALQGKISLENLRKLYTGEITNWQVLGGPDLPVRLYAPLDSESVRIFEEKVLVTDTAIDTFRDLLGRNGEQGITSLPTFNTFREVLRNFEENNVGAISFGALSRVFGQCSVYPLAIGTTNAVSALLDQSQKPITPQIDLCSEKGNYFPDYNGFINGRYPLAYPIAVVYPLDNRRLPVGDRFAAMFSTEEGQRLLQKTGLIPLQVPKSGSR